MSVELTGIRISREYNTHTINGTALSGTVFWEVIVDAEGLHMRIVEESGEVTNTRHPWKPVMARPLPTCLPWRSL